MGQKIEVLEHGVVYENQTSLFGYCAWPSVARRDDGALLMVCSGMRMRHVDPFGKVIQCESLDEGKTWSAPAVIVDTPLDDRDAGILNLGGGNLLVTTFNNSRKQQLDWTSRWNERDANLVRAYEEYVTPEHENRFFGSLVFRSEDGGRTYPTFTRLPITAPHGPCLCRDGSLVYVGKEDFNPEQPDRPVSVFGSKDGGRSWERLGVIPQAEEDRCYTFCEPHVIELPDQTLLAHIRVQDDSAPGKDHCFTIYQSVSEDGGKTWTTAQPTGASGSPPHLMLHSSGVLISVYGRRIHPFGERVMLSWDNGKTWDLDEVLTDEDIDIDLGYPASVELPNGDIFTLYYGKKENSEEKCSIRYTRWRIAK